MLYDTTPTVVNLTKAQYDALDPADQNNGTIYFITDINGTGDKFQPDMFSFNERQVGVWTDGKPLYQKTITSDSSSLEGISIDKIVGYDSSGSMAFRDNGTYMTPNSFISGNAGYSWAITFSVSSNVWSINIRTTGITLTWWYVTILYTKSTDAAGSGVWTPQGAPAHHYSTDEQVVGTWIDGKTLYEKTYSVSSSVSIGTSWSDTGFELPTNADRIIEGFIYRNAQSGALMYAAFSINTNNHHLNAMLAVADTLDSGSSITVRYTKST